MRGAALDAQLAEGLTSRPAAVRAAFDSYRNRCARLGIPPLEGKSLPLRPFMLSPEQASALQLGVNGLRTRLDELAPDRVAPSVEPELLAVWERHRRLPAFWHMMRPDTLFRGGVAELIDLNIGTPASVTCFEADLLRDFYLELFAALDLDPKELEPSLDLSVLERQCQSLRRHVPGFNRVAALLQSTNSLPEQLALFGGQLAGFLERLEQILEVEVVLTSPEEGCRSGLLASEQTLILQLGMSDLAVPARRRALMPLLQIPGVERRWISSPFTSLYEKQLLPLLAADKGLAPLGVPPSWPVEASHIDQLIANRQQLVLKHGRNLKRVLVGAMTPPELWRDAVVLSAHLGEYLAQERVVATSERIPVLLDGRVLTIEVIPEISPFVVDGEICAVFVRYLPVGSSSAVVSPPPADLGLGVAWVVRGARDEGTASGSTSGRRGS